MKVESEVKVYFIFTFSSLSTIIVSYRLKLQMGEYEVLKRWLQTVKVELKVESDNKLGYMAHWCIHPLGPASTSTLNHSIDLHRVDNYAV